MPLPEQPTAHWRGAFNAFLRRRFDRDSELGLRLTINVVLFVVGVFVLGNLIESVLGNEALVRWDLSVNRWFGAHATAGPTALFAAITLIGSPGTWVVMVIVGAWLLWRHEHILAIAWVATLVGGGIVQSALKHAVHRARPEYALAHLRMVSYSFPSGHTMDATICYPLLAILLSRLLRLSGTPRRLLLTVAFTLVLLVGFSRIYLGVHFPSDVLGGMAAGGAWLAAALVVLGEVERRRGPARRKAVPATVE